MRIVTTLQGTKFTVFQIERLFSECRAWLDFDSFHVVTDQKLTFHPEIRVHQLSNHPGYRGWWSKIYQFSLFRTGETMSLDIDLHVRNRFIPYFKRDRLIIPRDPLAKLQPAREHEHVNTSLFTYSGDWHQISERYEKDWQEIQKQYRGDQEWLWGEMRPSIDYHPDVMESYKWSARNRGHAVMPVIAYHGEDVKQICG